MHELDFDEEPAPRDEDWETPPVCRRCRERHPTNYPCYPGHNTVLSGLARECPKCHVIDHYEVEGRKPVEVQCKCGYRFVVQKYKKGQRPRSKNQS